MVVKKSVKPCTRKVAYIKMLSTSALIKKKKSFFKYTGKEIDRQQKGEINIYSHHY